MTNVNIFWLSELFLEVDHWVHLSFYPKIVIGQCWYHLDNSWKSHKRWSLIIDQWSSSREPLKSYCSWKVEHQAPLCSSPCWRQPAWEQRKPAWEQRKLLVTIHVITKSCSRNASQLSENSPPTFDFNFSSVRSSLRYDAPLLVSSHAFYNFSKAQFISSILFVYILVIFRLSKGHIVSPIW